MFIPIYRDLNIVYQYIYTSYNIINIILGSTTPHIIYSFSSGITTTYEGDLCTVYREMNVFSLEIAFSCSVK